jgi:hypothetical protein
VKSEERREATSPSGLCSREKNEEKDLFLPVEKGLENEFNCIATIHMDPVITQSERVNELKKVCQNIVKSIDFVNKKLYYKNNIFYFGGN